MKIGDVYMNEFEAALDSIVGAGNYPQSLLGDLADVLFQLERGQLLLKKLRQHSGSQRAGAKLLLELDELLRTELVRTLDDIAPPLRKARKLAWSPRAPKKSRAASTARKER